MHSGGSKIDAICFCSMPYKDISKKFCFFEKSPHFALSNSLITIDPILIKFYPSSYLILINLYLGRI